jgi:two-component system LytT family response regulator
VPLFCFLGLLAGQGDESPVIASGCGHKLMTKLRTLIVDDEPLSRARVRSFLRANPSVEVAGECGDGIEALEAIRSERPDIVFLDVQMPGCNGLQVLAKLPPNERPAIILVTAHDRFAVDAFAEQVVDYLLKPFDRERFEIALNRAIDHIRNQRAGDIGKRVEDLLATVPARAPKRIAVKADGRIVLLEHADIVWVEAANNYSTVHLKNSTRLMLRETLSSVEERLGKSSFVRVNRSALVHVDQVVEVQQTKYGDHQVLLREGTHLPLSRSLRGHPERFLK